MDECFAKAQFAMLTPAFGNGKSRRSVWRRGGNPVPANRNNRFERRAAQGAQSRFGTGSRGAAACREAVGTRAVPAFPARFHIE